MKKCLMLVLAIELALHGLCQSALQPVISPIRMNVVYRGIANPIAVAVPGYNWKDLCIEVDDMHHLECNNSGTCVLTPCNDADVRTLDVRATVTNDSGGKTTLEPVQFRIRRIPDPELFWVGKTALDRFIRKAEILSMAPVGAAMSNFDFEVNVRVTSFWLGIERNDEFRYYRSDNQYLTEEMQQALVMTQRGDRIWIGNASVDLPDGTQRELPPLLLTLLN